MLIYFDIKNLIMAMVKAVGLKERVDIITAGLKHAKEQSNPTVNDIIIEVSKEAITDEDIEKFKAARDRRERKGANKKKKKKEASKRK